MACPGRSEVVAMCPCLGGFYFPYSDHSCLVLLHILPLLGWDPRTHPRWNHPDPPNVLELQSAASFRAAAGCR